MKKIVLLFFIVALVSSCVSIKERVYVQDDKTSVDTNYPILNKEYKISTQDILYIKVRSLDNTSFESLVTVQLGNPDLLFYLDFKYICHFQESRIASSKECLDFHFKIFSLKLVSAYIFSMSPIRLSP